MAAKETSDSGFSAEEKAAMRARAKELKAEARRGDLRATGEAAVREAIEAMPDADRELATGVHELVGEAAPGLVPKTWYGMPAYANDDGKVVCFFQAASKFGARYGTVGFNDAAALDDGAMWPTAFALTELTPAATTQLRALVARAVAG